MIKTTEQSIGQEDYPTVPRTATPEASNADVQVPLLGLRRMVPAIVAYGGSDEDYVIQSADYNYIVNIAGLIDVLGDVRSLGRNDVVQQQAWEPSSGTGIYRMSAPTPPNHVAGFWLEWSIRAQLGVTMTMDVATFNFRNMSFASVDRHVKVTGGLNNKYSGRFAVLFAERTSYNDTCGCTDGGGCTTLAEGGMQQAVVTPAFVSNKVSAANPGLSIDSDTDEPYIQVTVPASMSGVVNFTAQYITKASQAEATLRQALGI
jgi:hypothetical protein